MKVFLSHAISDKPLIKYLKSHCNRKGIELLIAEHFITVSDVINQKIKSLIAESEIALILLTKDGTNSKFVHQEIGYIESLKKPALFIVEKGQQQYITGFVYGKDFIELDTEKPDIAIRKAINRLMLHWQKINNIKEREKEQATLFIVGIIGLVLLSND